MPRKIALGYLPAPACALAARAPHRQNGQALRSIAQPMAVGAVRKPRPAQGQRQAQVILGGVEPVQQPGVPGRQHPRRLLRVGLADTIRVAAELPAAFAHPPPGPLTIV